MIFSLITLQSYNLHSKFPNSPLRILYSTLLNYYSTLLNDNSTVQNIYSALQNKELNVVREKILHDERKNSSWRKRKLVVESGETVVVK